MSEKLEALWLVMRGPSIAKGGMLPHKLFRSREAARKYAADMRKRAKSWQYSVHRVTWGPEQ